jgi:hypothetical protein
VGAFGFSWAIAALPTAIAARDVTPAFRYVRNERRSDDD